MVVLGYGGSNFLTSQPLKPKWKMHGHLVLGLFQPGLMPLPRPHPASLPTWVPRHILSSNTPPRGPGLFMDNSWPFGSVLTVPWFLSITTWGAVEREGERDQRPRPLVISSAFITSSASLWAQLSQQYRQMNLISEKFLLAWLRRTSRPLAPSDKTHTQKPGAGAVWETQY